MYRISSSETTLRLPWLPLQAAKTMGFTTNITDNLPPRRSLTGRSNCSQRQQNHCSHHLQSTDDPACLIAGGETTVTIRGTGKGGRNQELALGAVRSLSGGDQMILVSLGYGWWRWSHRCCWSSRNKPNLFPRISQRS